MITMSSDLQQVTQLVLARARNQGSVLPREIREELVQAGELPTRWKEVVREAGTSLALRRGRYHYISRIRARMRQEHHQFQGVRRGVRNLIRSYNVALVDSERREQRRLLFLLPVTIVTADDTQIRMVTQDVSLNGVRVIGNRELRGQKVRVTMPRVDDGKGQWTFAVHFLWSAEVGDGLIESGGVFLSLLASPEE